MCQKLIFVIVCLMCLSSEYAQADVVEISGQLQKWHKITLTIQGPDTCEEDECNPFMDYRLNATFIHHESGQTFTVPGYYAADGNAKNSGYM